MNNPPTTFSCVECGGVAHLISMLADDDVLEDGTPLAYRCADCMDRFDVVWEPGDGDEDAGARASSPEVHPDG